MDDLNVNNVTDKEVSNGQDEAPFFNSEDSTFRDFNQDIQDIKNILNQHVEQIALINHNIKTHIDSQDLSNRQDMTNTTEFFNKICIEGLKEAIKKDFLSILSKLSNPRKIDLKNPFTPADRRKVTDTFNDFTNAIGELEKKYKLIIDTYNEKLFKKT